MDASNVQTETAETPPASLAQDWLRLLRHWLRNRWVLIALAAAVVTGGAILNWGWLVAIGIAPIILSLLPCAVMCAVGLCAMRRGNSACADESNREEAGRGTPPPAIQANRRDQSSGSE